VIVARYKSPCAGQYRNCKEKSSKLHLKRAALDFKHYYKADERTKTRKLCYYIQLGMAILWKGILILYCPPNILYTNLLAIMPSGYVSFLYIVVQTSEVRRYVLYHLSTE
jgi:hypothetical protein